MRVDMGKCQNILRLKNHSSFRCAFSLMLRYVIYVFSSDPIQRAVAAAWKACCGSWFANRHILKIIVRDKITALWTRNRGSGTLGNWETGKLGNWKIGKLGNWETGWLGWLGRLGWLGWLELRRRLGRFGRGGKLDNWEIGKLENWEFSR